MKPFARLSLIAGLAIAPLTLIASTAVVHQAAAQAPQMSAEQRAALAAAIKPTEMFATMRDGTVLAANVYLPKGTGPFPVVLSRTPYIKDQETGPLSAKRYLDAGYAYVIQDVRGKGHSKGFYQAFVNDVEDGYDTVEWVAAQPWSNGKTGMVGASALGITTNMAAMAAPPHLTAAYVIVAPYDMLQNTYMGGVLKDKDTIGWLTGQGYTAAQLKPTYEQVTDSIFWNQRSMSANRKYIRIPMYNDGGWYDIFNHGNVDNFEWLQTHGSKGAKGNQKLRMGPIGHGPLTGDLEYPAWADYSKTANEEMRWWDYWLKGVDNGIMKEPPVTYMMMGSARKGAPSSDNKVVHAAGWTPASHAVSYYLTPAKGLTTVAPTAAAGKISYRFDPKDPVKTYGGANLTFERGPMDQRAIPARQDYIRFQTAPLTIGGHLTVKLWASTDGPDTDFVAKVVDVYPDGYEALVLDAPIRARYRNGRMPDDVKMMTPGKPEPLTIDLWNTAITIAKGHRLAVHITSSNAPRFDVNATDGAAPGAKTNPRVATNTLWLDKAHPSALIVPVLNK
ncbi:CocE/NonD family hydrolase [soil metagenome]